MLLWYFVKRNIMYHFYIVESTMETLNIDSAVMIIPLATENKQTNKQTNNRTFFLAMHMIHNDIQKWPGKQSI